MFTKKFAKSAVVGMSLFGAAAANASDIEWNGFGSAYYGQALTEGLQPRGFTDTNSNFGSFSRLGLNLGSKLDDQLSFAAQFLASNSDQPDGDWALQAKWAYLTYGVSENFNVKLGRQLLPIMLASEVDQVGYLQPYRSIPSAVSVMVSMSGFNGLSGNYSLGVGDLGKVTFTAFGGRPNYDLPSNVTGEAKDLLGAVVTLDGDGYRLRAQYNRTRTHLVLGAPFNLTSDALVDLLSVGYRYEKNNIVTWGEYLKSSSTGGANVPAVSGALPGGEFLKSATGAYVLVGYRLGDFLPRYTYSVVDTDWGVIKGKNESHVLGVNYQLSAQAVFKVEYEMIKVPDVSESSPLLGTRATGSTETSGNAVYAGVDFIF